jgi:threonyl-tRNA synthetase
MPEIRLPDGSTRSYSKKITVADIALDIGEGLARAALAGKVEDQLVDLSFEISSDSNLSIITARDQEGIDVIRHSTAHLLAYAVKELFPDAQVTIGPVIDNGFYYDFSYKRPFTPEDLSTIEKKWLNLQKKILPLKELLWTEKRQLSTLRVSKKNINQKLLNPYQIRKKYPYTKRVIL